MPNVGKVNWNGNRVEDKLRVCTSHVIESNHFCIWICVCVWVWDYDVTLNVVWQEGEVVEWELRQRTMAITQKCSILMSVALTWQWE